MLVFIYLAYSMMALLYETVPAFDDACMEYRGDVGRYRMAIEDDDIGKGEILIGVVRRWYRKTLPPFRNFDWCGVTMVLGDFIIILRFWHDQLLFSNSKPRLDDIGGIGKMSTYFL
jgi:hypothetical protein